MNWTNQKVYTKKDMSVRSRFIVAGMRGLLPLTTQERQTLTKYANKCHLPVEEILHLRNNLKIDQEMNHCHSLTTKNRIMDHFNQLMHQLTNKQLSIKNRQQLIFNFLETSWASLNFILKIIKPLNTYGDLQESDLLLIDKIKQCSKKEILQSNADSRSFELAVEKWMLTHQITFQSEQTLRQLGYTLTPDLLFVQPIQISINNKSYLIHWMDAKNYCLANICFIKKSLRLQARKYIKAYGQGAFVFKFGLTENIWIAKNLLLLDGSFIH